MTSRPTAIVLAGGLGTRLRTVTGDLYPKPMAPTPSRNGVTPFLEWPLGWLERQGVREAIVCTGHLGERIADHFCGRPPRGMKVRIDHSGPVETGARCRSAFRYIAGDLALVVCGDVFVDFPLEPLLAEMARVPEALAMLTVAPPPEGMKANILTDGAGRVTAFEREGTAAPGAAKATGVLMLRRDALDGHEEGDAFSLVDHVYPRLIREGRLFARPVGGEFHDIGAPERLERFCALSRNALPAEGLLETAQ